MIHVWLEQLGVREKDPHGSKFIAKVNELNARFPKFNIKRRRENAADYTVANSKS